MSNNNSRPPGSFFEVVENANQNYTRDLFNKSLIQSNQNSFISPNIFEKYTTNLQNSYPEILNKANLSENSNIFSSEKNNNWKDPRIKSEFYQEKAFTYEGSKLEQISSPDFIKFSENKPKTTQLIEINDDFPAEHRADPNTLPENLKKIKKFSKPARTLFNRGERSSQNSHEIDATIPQITPKFQQQRDYLGKDLTELIRKEHQKLPIFLRFKAILDALEKEQVTVISGDTGCGKSTQVPKYIYLDSRSKGKKVRIVCTQPRRMAALNLAKRVAFELDEKLGGIVGYQISLDSKQNENTAILYVTNGIFLQSLIHDKNIFDEVTHVILDEIHERDIDSDFTMIAMKHLLSENSHIKLILMSATINVQLFVNYFSRDEIQNCHLKEYNYSLNMNSKKWEKLNNWEDFDPKVLLLNKGNRGEEDQAWDNFKVKREKEHHPYGSNRRIDGANEFHFEQYDINMNDLPACCIEIGPIKKLYHVDVFYIDTIENYLGKNLINGIEFRYIDFDRKKPALHYECVQLALEIIKKILAQDDQQKHSLQQKNLGFPKNIDGSILIFLPGLNEINNFILKIEENLNAQHLDQLKIIPLHSALPDSQNEQIFDRKEPGRRKVIVSTNIAESSITVPDIVYVIDFCLTKETNYNPYNNMEKLELSWASQASARQRSGRTGRVCNGICFRLVPKIFFEDHLLAFTTPELLRSPLDKLILRIKTINEDDPKNIFEDPQKVLGRAIQPPHIDNISYALKSLQDAGALTWSIDKSYKSCKITQLGKIYCDLPCDIRICKLCIMGFIFNCLQEAVTIGATLQHQKTMFVLNSRLNPRDQSKFYKNISNYDRGLDSDLILMMNIFNEWEERFGSLEKSAKYQNIDLFEKESLNVKFLKREFRRNKVSEEERKWCKLNFLDPIVLREILIQREDIKQRLKKFNFQDNHYRCSYKISQTTFLKLKIMFAASFNNNFLKASQKWDARLEKKLLNLKNSFNINTKCTLIVTYSGFNSENLSPQQIMVKEAEWKEIFNNYGVIDKIKFNYNEAYVIFKESSSEEAIKYLLYRKTINNSLKPVFNCEDVKKENKPIENKQNYQRMFGSLANEEKEKYFMESIGAFDYLHLCQFNDLLRGHPVIIDNDSINKFVFSNGTSTGVLPMSNPFKKPETIITNHRQQDARILICFDYQERSNNKHYTRYTTLLPDFPLLAPLLLLVFSALPQLKVSSDKGRYEKIMIDEHEISLDYFITEKDIEDINNLRTYLRDNLTAESLSKAPTDSFWNMLLELLTKERIKYYEPEMWEDSFKLQTKNSVIFENLLNKNSNSNKEPQCITKFIRTQGKSNNVIGNSTNENKRIIDFQIYLPNIEKPSLEFSSTFDISREEGKLMYKMYQDSYNQWKLKVLDDMNTHKRFLELKQTFLACGKCKLPISDIKNLKEKDPEIFFLRKFIPNPYDVSTLNYNSDDEFCSSEQYFEVDELFGKDLEFYGCRNDHIIGIRPKNIDSIDWFIYITEHSNLIILYPDLTEEIFDFFKFDMKRVLELENFKFKKKKQIIIDMKYECPICQETGMTGADYLTHLKDSRKHKEYLKEFQSSLQRNI